MRPPTIATHFPVNNNMLSLRTANTNRHHDQGRPSSEGCHFHPGTRQDVSLQVKAREAARMKLSSGHSPMPCHALSWENASTAINGKHPLRNVLCSFCHYERNQTSAMRQAMG